MIRSACRIRVFNFDAKRRGHRSTKASWAPKQPSSTLAQEECRATSSMAMRRPNPWQRRCAGSALPRRWLRSDHQSSFDPGLTSFSLPFISLLTAHSTSHHGAGGCSNGSNFLITGWRYVRSESSLSKVVYVTHVTQCIDGKDVLAVYEAGQASRDYSALLTIRHAGLAVVTEIVTTLMLSQMAIVMQWQN